MKALIIEDDAECREIFQMYLAQNITEESIDFLAVGTLSDGLALAANADVIILDLLLPDSPTPEGTLQSFAPIMQNKPTIVVSALDEFLHAMDAIEQGARGYVCKPKLEGFVSTFLSIVKGLQNGHRSCDENLA